MTHEERTNIESYLDNLNNLIELKKVLQQCLLRVEGDIEWSMFQIEEQPDDDCFNPVKMHPSLRSYSELMQATIEDLLPCWKLAIK